MNRVKLLSACLGILVVMWKPGDVGVVAGLGVAYLAARVLAGLTTGAADRIDGVRREQLPIAIDVMSLGLDAGIAWHQAVAYAAACVDGPIAEPLVLAAHRLELGARAGEVWTGDAVLEQIGETVRRSERSGAAVSDLLRQSADAMRAASRAEHMSRAKRLGVTTMGPVTLCFLPAFMLLGLAPLVGSLLADLHFW